jgi:hypothetical protein
MLMSQDLRLEKVAEVAARAPQVAKLDISISLKYDIPLLVGPQRVPKGQKTEDAPLVEDRRAVVLLDTDYLIALYESRYCVFQRDAEGRWFRRKTPKRVYYKSLRQVLADVFEGIIWDRMKSLKYFMYTFDNLILTSHHNIDLIKEISDKLGERVSQIIQGGGLPVDAPQAVPVDADPGTPSEPEPGLENDGGGASAITPPLKRRLQRTPKGGNR